MNQKKITAAKDAETKVEVDAHLEIVEDSRTALKLRLHRRNYKEAVTIHEFIGTLVMGIFLPSIIILLYFIFPGVFEVAVTWFCVAITSIIVFGHLIMEIDRIKHRVDINLDMTGGRAVFLHRPLLSTRELSLDQVKDFHLYSRHSSIVLPYSVMAEVHIKKDPQASMEQRLFSLDFDDLNKLDMKDLAAAIIEHLNRALGRYQMRGEVPYS